MEFPVEARERLLVWFRENKRDLPWRRTRDPYRILVSEIMLQQTRVEAVREYYARFLARFPSAEALASAHEDEVLKAWEGLGYYTRARNLHRAAKVIASEGFPTDYAGIRALPGVGDYTAGAISSIAFSLPTPAVDGNVLRVLSRLFCDASNTDDPKTKAAYTAVLKGAYPKGAEGEFTEALMELGATVCLPNGAPLCGVCPWHGLCKAQKNGCQEDYPVRSGKKARKIVNAVVCVLEREGKYAVERRAAHGLLAGMWQIPFFEEEPPAFGKILCTKKEKHVFTHVEWHMTGRLIKADAFFPAYEWKTAEEIKNVCALPSAFKAFTEWLK